MKQPEYSETEIVNFIFDSLVDSLHTDVYVTDIQTDEVLYMSEGKKKEMKITSPEGNVCWKLLRKGMSGPCQDCPVPTLIDKKSLESAVRWKEEDGENGRIYERYSTVVPWLDGRLVHICKSVDITGYSLMVQEKKLDELTGMLTRRVGKDILEEKMSLAKEQGVPLTVCMYDLNELKMVNDDYGRREGDNVLAFVACVALESLSPNDRAFRLSGDEFVIIFYDKDSCKADEIMQSILKKLADAKAERAISYEMSFSYGMAEYHGEDGISGGDLLTKADAGMYIKKREYRIRNNEKRLDMSQEEYRAEIEQFTYDKEHVFEALSVSSDDYLYVGNMKTGTFRYSPSMVAEFGLPGEIVVNASAVWGSHIHPNDKKLFLEANQDVADGRCEAHNVEYRAKNCRGQWVWLRCRGRLVRDEDGEPNLFAGFITNLGKRNRHDHLTGLYNKFELEEEAKRLMEDYPDIPFGLMVLGLDDFKHVNDLHDRGFGDEVLRMTAQRIVSLMAGEALVYRMDGDEFCVLVKNGGAEDFRRLYLKIYAAFQHQQEYQGRKFHCTLSAGCASYPVDGSDYQDLLKFADYALEYSKNSGKNRMTLFSRNILSHKERSLELTELLRECIERGYEGFSLNYQPQVNAANSEVMGAEALVRWKSDKYGNVPPIEFIPLLEKSGMIIQVGKWIFREAVRQCRRWLGKKPNFMMSINLSYLQIIEPDFVPFVKRTLEESGVPFDNIMVELTETCLVKEKDNVRDIFANLRSMGIYIAMDDFGTGYSSLGVLKETPVDVVKIDQTFVRGIQQDTFDSTFIHSIVALCHNVGKEVCVEGVETMTEYGIVKSSGLEYIQGYYFGRPVVPEVFEDVFLNSQKS